MLLLSALWNALTHSIRAARTGVVTMDPVDDGVRFVCVAGSQDTFRSCDILPDVLPMGSG